LLLGSTLPMWVVTSFRGEGRLLVVDFSVDMNVGDGLWLRNVCFGSRVSEDILNKAGLSCDGTMQTEVRSPSLTPYPFFLPRRRFCYGDIHMHIHVFHHTSCGLT